LYPYSVAIKNHSQPPEKYSAAFIFLLIYFQSSGRAKFRPFKLMTGNEYISEETVLQKLLMHCYGTQMVIMLMVMQGTEKPR
jgi:hypothetical protein